MHLPHRAHGGRTPEANPEDTWRLYSALADAAGVVLPLRVDNPRVMVGRLRSAQEDIALVINLSAEPLEVKLKSLDGVAYGRNGTASGAPLEVLVLPPFGVEVLKRLS